MLLGYYICQVNMRKRRLVRFQLWMLLFAFGLVVWRYGVDADRPDGVVVFSDLTDGRLYRAGLQVDQASDVLVSLTAAFETDETDAPLAVYGWILNNDDLSVVWKTEKASLERDGVIARTVDTIHVAKGSYEVFFTTVGPTAKSRRNTPFLGLRPYWTNYKSEWQMSVSLVGHPQEKAAAIRRVDAQRKRETDENVIWATGPTGNRVRKSFLFRVSAPVRLDIYSVGEICTNGCDLGRIENMLSSELVWQMSWGNTAPAGGQEKNRVFKGAVELEPGIYSAVYETDGGHSSEKWNANPPFDPDGWGFTLSTFEKDRIAEVDPWKLSEPLVDLTRIGDDELKRTQFSLSEPTGLIVYVMGEISSGGSLYDYAWIENNSSRETLWEMSRAKSQAAGGDARNRVEMAFLQLEPGSYTVYYRSDDSHSFERWRKRQPRNPERWGVTVFPADAGSFNAASFKLLELKGVTTELFPGETVEVAAEAAASTAEEIVGFHAVGNDADLSQTFELESDSKLRIVAQGELSSGGRYDYGWIEHKKTGEKVWEMTVRNSRYAGGEDRNRRFEGVITLPSGAYVAHYISDFSHAFGDFGDGQPDVPRDWGMRIFYVSR